MKNSMSLQKTVVEETKEHIFDINGKFGSLKQKNAGLRDERKY